MKMNLIGRTSVVKHSSVSTTSPTSLTEINRGEHGNFRETTSHQHSHYINPKPKTFNDTNMSFKFALMDLFNYLFIEL
jgi:hypothetical protein